MNLHRGRPCLYALALYATRPAGGGAGAAEHEVYLRVALAVAAGESEARAKVTARLMELCPPEQGWLNHHVTLDRVPRESLEELLSAVAGGGDAGGEGDGLDFPELLM
jgi:hypothetical protein